MSNFDSWWLPVTTSGDIDTVLSRPAFHCTQLSGSVHTDRAQRKVGPACLSKMSVHVLLAFKLFLRMIKPVSVLPFCMYAANYSNLTSSLVPSVSAVSSVMWQECGLPCTRLRGTDGEWQGRELPSKINRSTVLHLAFQRGWLYALKSLSCLTETRYSIGSDKISNFIYQATKMVVLSEVGEKYI